MTLFLQVVAVAAAALATLAGVVWFMVKATDADRPRKWLIGGAAFTCLAAAAWVTFVFYATNDGDGLHRWEGGAGPETECWFETEHGTIMVSNGSGGQTPIPTETTYTVCGKRP